MTGWIRVTKDRPCPVCSKPDWCTVTVEGTAACCMRLESAKPLGNGGWLHRLRHDDWHRPRRRRVELSVVMPARDFGDLSARYVRACGDGHVARLAQQLGVSAKSLRRLHVGYDGRAFTFPMRTADGVICGIRLRYPDGRKLSVKGGREGVFIPDDLSGIVPLFVCEGATDTAAMLTLGFPAIGRPSCSGGVAHIVQLTRGRDAVIIGDQDTPGKRGAIRLASSLRPCCPSVHIIVPPREVKDARAWVRAGATRSDIESTLDNGPIVRFAEPTRRAVGVSYCETGLQVCPDRSTVRGAGSA